jgi:membrane-bound lytic murein transglycosylase A
MVEHSTSSGPRSDARGRLFVPVDYAELPGWKVDDQLAALRAFLVTCQSLTPSDDCPGNVLGPLKLAADMAAQASDIQVARTFFEQYFVPYRVSRDGSAQGFVTGYFEPVLQGARWPSPAFLVPLYRRPPDLINVVDEASRGAAAVPFTHVRRTSTGCEPYATRAEIEAGALAGQGLELVYLADAVDAFFLQVQGSGLIECVDGTTMRLTYDGKNGHPYTSIGKVLIEQGVISAQDMTLDVLSTWLRAHPQRAPSIMRENKSYVFFRALTGAESNEAHGVMDAPLSEGRSLAVDTAYHRLGLPIYLHSPALKDDNSGTSFSRLMIAQDVGSAIKGPERGDIYFGSGQVAGARAGVTKHACSFFALLPAGVLP